MKPVVSGSEIRKAGPACFLTPHYVALRNRAMALHDVDHRPPTEIDTFRWAIGW
jgi:hypothetical protein